MFLRKYGTPGGITYGHVAFVSDVSHDDSHVHVSLDMPTLDEYIDE
jgi:hypothetical protein